MAYDALTADRFRYAIKSLRGITEKPMMGGVCFLLNGNMIGGADRPKHGEPRFMFRLGKENHIAGLALKGAQPMINGKRRMPGFFFVDEAVCNDELLQEWVDLSVCFASDLNPK